MRLLNALRNTALGYRLHPLFTRDLWRVFCIGCLVLLVNSCGGGSSNDSDDNNSGGNGDSGSCYSCSTVRVCGLFSGGCSNLLTCFNRCAPSPTNAAPSASLNANKVGVVGQNLLLDATASDPEGDPLNYNWALLSKPETSTLSLPDDSGEDLTVVPDVFGRYVFGLVVDDGDLQSENLYAMVDVENPQYADFVLSSDIIGIGTRGLGSPITIDADLNGDGLNDLVIGRCDGTVWTYLNDGAGGFTPADSEAAYSGCNSALVTADFNGDGDLDVASYNLILQGDGEGNLAPLMSFGFLVANTLGGDFNGDDLTDLALVKAEGGDYSIMIMFSNGDGSFSVGHEFPPIDFGATLVADFNADGLDDLVFYDAVFDDNGDSGISVMLGNAEGSFSASRITLPGNGAMGAADFNGDGDLDLVVSYYLGTLPDTPVGVEINVDVGIAILFGDGNGSFAPPQIQSAANIAYSELGIYDFTADGNLDLVYLGDNSLINVLAGNGSGGFDEAILIEPDTDVIPQGFSMADLDGDPIPDIILTSTLNSFSVGQQHRVEIIFGVNNQLP